MRWIVRGLIGLAVVIVLGVAGYLLFTPQGRLVGSTYAVPDPASGLPAGMEADGGIILDFRTGARASQLASLAPDLTPTASVREGRLNLRGEPGEAGWYSDRSGPMLFRTVSGDFMAGARVRSVRWPDGAGRPTGNFNSAGLLVRDPSSTRGQMNWLMYNMGQQLGFTGLRPRSPYRTGAVSTRNSLQVFGPDRRCF